LSVSTKKTFNYFLNLASNFADTKHIFIYFHYVMAQHEFNVMIVEDDLDNQMLLSTIVSQLKCKTYIASNGRRALNNSHLDKMDLILLDINMPEMNGYQFCSEIKNRKKTKEIPVIFVSALSGTEDVLKAFEAGGADYIPKPFQIDEVKARVSVQLMLKQKSQRLKKTIEKLIKTQNELYRSRKLASLGVLTAGIAHEINNPVNFIYNGANSLKQDFDDIRPFLEIINGLSRKGKNYLSAINELKSDIDLDEILKTIPQTIDDIKYGAQRTTEIVKGLINFSHIDEPDKKATDIHDCINSTLLILRNKIKDNIKVIKKFDNSMPQIMTYPGEISQVFLNIINNAVDAFSEEIKKNNFEKVISIITARKKKYVQVIISDNGSGISEGIIDNIFDPFFTTKNVGEGTGLGLSISYGIIKKHNGKIAVNSKIGQGTKFSINLPV
jgi:signal transduction histidine kinase